MWVFCCGMMRSGSTLQFQITARLVEEAGLGKRVEWVKPEDFPAIREKYSEYRGLKVFKSHVCTEDMVAEFSRKNAIGVYVFRDIRDVCASMLKKEHPGFLSLWRSDLVSSNLENFKRWTKLKPMLVSKYETMISALSEEAQKIGSHLGVPAGEELCRKIASEYSLDRQKKRIAEAKKNNTLVRPLEKGPTFDSHSLLHDNHISSGEVRGWRRELTPVQVAMVEKKAENWLRENGYEISNPRLSFLEKMWIHLV